MRIDEIIAALEAEKINEISLKTKVNAYSRTMDPEFDYYADGTHNPKRKIGQSDRLRAAIARKHGEEVADQADDQAAYDHYGDYMFKNRKVPAHVKQREPVTELSDKRLRKYVKKATKSADSLAYYSDGRTDPDWEKSQKRKKMVDVAKDKLAKTNEAKVSPRKIVFAGTPFSVAHIDDKYTEDGLYMLVGPGQSGVMRYHDLKHAVHQCKFENKEIRKRFKTPAEFNASFGIKESFPYDVDHMPGPTVDKLSKGCTTCHGRKAVYKLPNGSVRADNVKGAKRIACPTCKGTGIKESQDKQAIINSLAERIAANYKANEYEEFEQDMLNTLPKELKHLANLPELFDLYNPARQREGGEIWARMLKNPEKYIR